MTQEEIILREAELLFMEKGFNGTSTTEIAKRAGCNQALVHYYYRTKEQLFQKIFTGRIEDVLRFLGDYVRSQRTFTDNMLSIIDGYFDYLSQHRQIPFMIINELILNPDRRAFVRNAWVKSATRMSLYEYYCNLVRQEIAEGRIRQIEPFDLLVQIVSQTAMTFVSLPMYTDILEKDEQEVLQFINHRRDDVKESLLRYLKP